MTVDTPTPCYGLHDYPERPAEQRRPICAACHAYQQCIREGVAANRGVVHESDTVPFADLTTCEQVDLARLVRNAVRRSGHETAEAALTAWITTRTTTTTTTTTTERLSA